MSEGYERNREGPMGSVGNHGVQWGVKQIMGVQGGVKQIMGSMGTE